MPCVGRRGCAERFRDLPASQLLAILAHHGSCAACGKDATDHPRFGDPVTVPCPVPARASTIPVPYCPACFEERWPTGAPGPFERGQPQVYRNETGAG